ncbi:MAG: GNAT family N-acetyltransferase [Sedimenticola sp.]
MSIEIREAHWPEDLPLLREVREEVFVREQHVPADMEWDTSDPVAVHLLAETPDGQPVGTVRLLPGGQIGRMAVLPEWRNQGTGRRLMEQIMSKASELRYPKLFLNTQIRAVPFYRQFGFKTQGEEFMEAGIPHLRMEMDDDDN